VFLIVPHQEFDPAQLTPDPLLLQERDDILGRRFKLRILAGADLEDLFYPRLEGFGAYIDAFFYKNYSEVVALGDAGFARYLEAGSTLKHLVGVF
jgi:hypothetical protein